MADAVSGIRASAERLNFVELVAGEIKSELLELICRLDDPHRLGPCLFFITPEKPEFLKDAGKMFGSKFCLHLCCERTLLPVSWFESTQGLGRFEFVLERKWWSKVKPFLKIGSRLIGSFVPAAALLGTVPGLESVLAVSGSEAVKLGKEILENTEELLEIEEVPTEPESEGGTDPGRYGLPELTRATDLALNALHSFLVEKSGKQDLEIANLGLVRRWDKGQGRHLWVHESQKDFYEAPRPLPVQ